MRVKAIGKLMDWIRKVRQSEAEATVLARTDRVLADSAPLVEVYRRQLEVLSGQRVVWPERPQGGITMEAQSNVEFVDG